MKVHVLRGKEKKVVQPGAVKQSSSEIIGENKGVAQVLLNCSNDDKSSEQKSGTLLEIPAEISNFKQVE